VVAALSKVQAMVNEGDAAETDWCAPAVGILLCEG
jgi:hypothetical protein